MRRVRVAVPALAAIVLAGCGGGDEPTVLGVTTPPASATASAGASATAPAGGPATATTGTAVPDAGAPAATGTARPAGALQAYQALVADWQHARATFFAAVSDGQPRTAAQQRALAAAYLSGQRRFSAGLRGVDWPDGALRSVRALAAELRRQQDRVAAMTAAGTAGGFTARLADYGAGTAAENAAVAAVTASLS